MRLFCLLGLILLITASCRSNEQKYNVYDNKKINEVAALAKEVNQPFCIVLRDSLNLTADEYMNMGKEYKIPYKGNDIYVSVPEMQQERLFNITSVLYYSMKEIQDLETQGLMIQTPQSSMKRLLVKTRSESDGGSFGDSCRKFLATVWVIAVGEPTPAGEIVAAVATVFVGGVLLYEVVVCKKTNSSDYEYCQRKFRECWAPSGTINNCEQCFRRNCISNGGVWPGASMNCY